MGYVGKNQSFSFDANITTGAWQLALAVQRLHHADAREHHPATAAFGGVDQRFHRDLPAFLLLNIRRQFHNEIAGVLERGEFSAAAQRDGRAVVRARRVVLRVVRAQRDLALLLVLRELGSG